MDNIDRLEAVVARLPEAERVAIAEWGDHPTYRVRGRNFVFSDQAASILSLKLAKDEAAAVVATDPSASPTGYGLGRHGWVTFAVEPGAGDERWAQIEEWARTSYALVAPKRLARQVTLPFFVGPATEPVPQVTRNAGQIPTSTRTRRPPPS